MPWASFSMLDGPGGTDSAKTQVSSTRFLQSEVKIIYNATQMLYLTTILRVVRREDFRRKLGFSGARFEL